MHNCLPGVPDLDMLKSLHLLLKFVHHNYYSSIFHQDAGRWILLQRARINYDGQRLSF